MDSVGTELATMREGLDHFRQVVTAPQGSDGPLDIVEGRRLIGAMTFTVTAAYAVASSQNAKDVAHRHRAVHLYQRLIDACSQDRQIQVAGLVPPADESPGEVEAAVTRCYEVARYILMAAADLSNGLNT